MGLDMYLEKRHYVRRWDHTPAEKQFEVTVKRGGEPYAIIKPERVSYVTEHIAYWRKANAIHGWFVTNVQGGKDDCEAYHVEREQLEELLALAKAALKSPAPEGILPTQSGFFFGDISYGENYRVDMEDTIQQLTAALAEPDTGEFYYNSSW